ncbi:co-chaperone DjlA [Enterobacteriaceae endosymbiont of Donacia versicolorea]|uniref:co-chaperone DjlA n=1 Tax=Enterobacteriaceae endosymbiont of Donacia versicolorea TaxID=2675788 RepID=UPI00144942E0|nr:co-chaperone DjlA [Enterobacteriaceae endosymbiont of Donacia versicolorea]QJC32032.1 co-chaperone DjlA [Enterobacteriaceae endosymbiont of Donacia versicolorea]
MFFLLQLLLFLISFIINYNISYSFMNIIIIILISFLINKIYQFYYKNNYSINNIKKSFIQITFEVMGYISKSKGFVSNNDIMIATKLIKKMKLNSKYIIFAHESFTNGKNKNYPLIYKLNNLNYLIYKDTNLINKFLEIQLELSFINKSLNPKTRKILFIIFQELKISLYQVLIIINKLKYKNKNINEKDLFSYKNDYKFKKQTENNNFNYDNYQNINYNEFNLNQAYKLLGVKPEDNLLTIKRAYHKLISKYHPDKLISKGYTSKQLEIAKIKTQNIHKAYNMIKKNII